MNKTIFWVLNVALLCAKPTGHRVASGSAQVAHEGNRTTVTASDRSVIEWNHFSIGKGETAQFNLPSSCSKILNRVTGTEISSIHGHLLSNGQVVLINPNGIVFGKDCVVRTASLIASTLDVHDDYHFVKSKNSSIVNEGLIEVEGDLFLIASSVENNGTLRGNRVEIAVADEVWLKPEEDRALWIRSDSNRNSDGFEWAINQTGFIQANSLVEKEGRVFLAANGKVKSAGEVASQGNIGIFGTEVFIPESGVINTEGLKRGGDVHIGKDSELTLVQKGARIQTSCTDSGDAGRVVVDSNGYAFFEGQIDAKGGPNGGDGGFVEVSGRKNFHFSGLVDRSAPLGKTGELLLDPSDINITGAATSGNVAFAANTYTVTGPAPSPANILNTDIVANLGLGPVTITTASPFSDAGNIAITSSISWVTANSLTLIADGNITLTNAVISSLPPNDITLQAGGDIILNASGANNAFISSVGGIVTAQAGRDIQILNTGSMDAFIGVAIGGSRTFITAGRDIIQDNAGGSPSNNGAAIGATTVLQTFAGRDHILANPRSFLLSAFGPIEAIANRNISIGDIAGIFVADSNGSITVVVDNQAPTPPNIGDGGISISSLGAIGTAPSGPIPPFPPPANVRIYTARRSQNDISNINFAPFTASATAVNSDLEIFGVWFPSGIPITHPFGFIIFYKESELLPFVAETIGSTFDTLRLFEYSHPLTLYDEVARFCVRVKGEDREDSTYYPIFMENYREWARSAGPLP